MSSSIPEPSPQDLTPAKLLCDCYPQLLARVRWMMGVSARRLADSGDFLGELTTRILEQADRLRIADPKHFLRLATRMARNLIADTTRRRQPARFASMTSTMVVEQRLAATDPSPSHHAAEDEAAEQLLDALESLAPDDIAVIELRDLQGLPYKEVARELGRSENATQVLHRRAVERLGRRLRGGGRPS
ncbi:MAG: sigma-70 family RNA polymerase sigma factor [Planctomycetes bacterium]|nr:sigma-70 family RNA polymerase sigma factor [Planctomycetota bacterium]